MRSFMLIALCSAVIFASVDCLKAAGNNLDVGTRVDAKCYDDDRLIYDEEVTKSNKWGMGGGFKETKTYTLPRGIITKITAVDSKKKGATVEILKGGVGQKSVTLLFKNKEHGFRYNVKVYGAKEA